MDTPSFEDIVVDAFFETAEILVPILIRMGARNKEEITMKQKVNF